MLYKLAQNYEQILELVSTVDHVEGRNLQVKTPGKVHTLVLCIMCYLHSLYEACLLVLLEIYLKDNSKILLFPCVCYITYLAPYLKFRTLQIGEANREARKQNTIIFVEPSLCLP